MSNLADSVTKDMPSPLRVEAHANFAAAMRSLIRLGLPVVEVSQDQLRHTVQMSSHLLEIYRRSSEVSCRNVSVLIGTSMEIRQILTGLPRIYLSVLRDCLLQGLRESAPTMPAHQVVAIAADVDHRITELQHDVWPNTDGVSAAPPAGQLANDLVHGVEEAHKRGSDLLRTQVKPEEEG